MKNKSTVFAAGSEARRRTTGPEEKKAAERVRGLGVSKLLCG